MIFGGFDVEVHVNLTSQGMNMVKRKVTEESKNKDANCFLMLIIRFVNDINVKYMIKCFSLAMAQQTTLL